MVGRNAQILGRMPASQRDISSLRNWVNLTGSISRDETTFLEENDMMTASSSGNDALAVIEPKIEDVFVGIHGFLSRVNPIYLAFCIVFRTHNHDRWPNLVFILQSLSR